MNTLNTSNLASIGSYKKYGVTRSVVHWVLQHDRNLNPRHSFYDCLRRCYILYWKGEYILNQMQAGVIRKDDISYHVVFAPHLSRGILMRGGNRNYQFSLSFRQAQPGFELPAYVYISEAFLR